MKYLARADEMRQIDQVSINELGMPELVLMERAALAVAEEVKRVEQDKFDFGGRTPRVLVVTENGNNGGDGLAVARLLIDEGYVVAVYNINAVPHATESFKTQMNILQKMNCQVANDFPEGQFDIIIDAIFGVGLKRPVEGVHEKVVNRINKSGAYVVAVDMPTGVNASTGAVLGTAVKADMTVTFGLTKLGQVMYPGGGLCGRVVVRQIGFPKAAVDKVSPKIYTYDRCDLARLPKRDPASNKGTVGKVAIIAGSEEISGAATLATLAAYKMGAGMVKVYTHEKNRTILATTVPEALMMTYEDAPGASACVADANSFGDAVLIGPGIGMGECGRALVAELVKSCTKPVVADADALNILAENLMNFDLRKCRKMMVTPHMKEMSRLTKKTVDELKAEPLVACAAFADRYDLSCAMKDARTVVSDGSDTIYVNTSGNDGMATAGSGDVLAGIAAALLAAGLTPAEAAPLAVHVHGLAGDMAAQTVGRRAMVASDIVAALGLVL